MKTKRRSTDQFVQIDLDVKDWLQSVPSVEAARPGQCPRCGVASRPAGQTLRLHGHGTRSRQVQGPLEVTGTPRIVELLLRRYLCTECGAVIVVGPRGLLGRRLYSAVAVALALARWALLAQSAAEVRDHVSPWRAVGPAAKAGWAALRRWARALRKRQLWPELLFGASMNGSLRETAGKAAVRLAALGSVPGPAWIAAASGAARAR